MRILKTKDTAMYNYDHINGNHWSIHADCLKQRDMSR